MTYEIDVLPLQTLLPAIARAEDQLARRTPRGGAGKDIAEVENYVRGFARRRPEILITTLRAAQTPYQE